MGSAKQKMDQGFCLEQGLMFDVDEGWRKLISRQFGGDPGRAFGEMIQNLLDSYPSRVPWEKRRGEIRTGAKEISITDYGEGMDLKRIKLIATLGGTDKAKDVTKIGRFGIGFFSIFNPKLGTKTVQVLTKCEGRAVEILFSVNEPEKRPTISTRVLRRRIRFSTRITVKFTKKEAVYRCVYHAKKVLRYYPCCVEVNKKRSFSVWAEAKRSKSYIFREGPCHGILKTESNRRRVELLCKYEYVMALTMRTVVTGGHDMTWDLRDYHLKEMPVMDRLAVIINCDRLRLTIARDSFFLDSNYRELVNILSKHMLLYLNRSIDWEADVDVILANHYVLRRKIKKYLEKPECTETEAGEVLERLVAAKVYPISGRKGLYSIADMSHMRSKDLPIFFSPNQSNLYWLGGAFKHDFVILPQEVRLEGGAPDLYDRIFGDIFGDAVNLDSISGDNEKVKELIERDIIDRSDISPMCRFLRHRSLTKDESRFLEELGYMLNSEQVKGAIERTIHVPVESIQPAFFEQEGEGIVATGLFLEQGEPWDGRFSNEMDRESTAVSTEPETPMSFLLGIRRDHPVVFYILNSEDPYRLYYMLMFLARELALCQKLLVPFSPYFHRVKEDLACEMRNALIAQLLERTKGDQQNGDGVGFSHPQSQ